MSKIKVQKKPDAEVIAEIKRLVTEYKPELEHNVIPRIKDYLRRHTT